MEIQLGSIVQLLYAGSDSRVGTISSRCGNDKLTHRGIPESAISTTPGYYQAIVTYDVKLSDGRTVMNVPAFELRLVQEYSVDKLVGANGDWHLRYLWNRHGNNFLLLLPDACNRTQAIIDMCMREDFEESIVISRFADSTESPFISTGIFIYSSLANMDARLALCCPDTFRKKVEEFEHFLKVCELIVSADDSCAVHIAMNNWKDIIVPETR